jgi:SH3 domain protein
VTKKIFLALTLTLCSLLASAQDTADTDTDIQYVTDQLRLSLYTEASAQSKVLKLLQSGDALNVEEIRGPYALVTAADGTRGWVKRGFLVNSPTANILLREEEEKNAELLEEVEKLGNSKVIIDTYEKDMDEMKGQIAVLESERGEANENIAMLQQTIDAKQQELDRKSENNEPVAEVLAEVFLRYWKIIVPVFLFLLLLCFLISKVIVEARIKARFQGIKIW